MIAALTTIAAGTNADVLSQVHPLAASTALLRNSGPAGVQSGSLLYYGGPVLANVKVVMVNWTSSVDPTIQANLPNFYSQMVTASPPIDWLSEYSTVGVTPVNNTPGTNQTLGHGSFSAAVTITPAANPDTITNAQIQTELARQIASGHLPAPDANTLYMVNFPPGHVITGPGGVGRSCQDFCTFHDNFMGPTTMIRYAVLPDYSSCPAGCGLGSLLDHVTLQAWHVLAECITDPDIETSVAWYQVANGEISDFCTGEKNLFLYTSGSITWLVQTLWSNVEACCIFSPSSGCVPASVTDGATTAVSLELGANPVTGAALLRFALPIPADVDLAVFDVAGRRIATLAHGTIEAGQHVATWIATATPAGVYFARLTAGGHTLTRPIVLRH